MSNLFVDASQGKDVAPAGASVAVTGLKPGCLYLVIADGDAYLNYGAAAASKKNFYIPAKVPMYLMFGDGSTTLNLDVRCFAAAGVTVFFTPAFRMSPV